MANYDSILLIVKTVFGLVAIVGLTYYVLRPLFKSISGIDDRVESTRSLSGRHSIQEEELEIPTSRPTDISKQAIIKKALDDPMRTTQLVRNWLREKK